jgi:nucleolar complex protein 2
MLTSTGTSKLASNSKAYATAQRLIKSYFVSLQSLLATTSSDSGIPSLAVSESGKLVPWIVGNRKVARAWTKVIPCFFVSFPAIPSDLFEKNE